MNLKIFTDGGAKGNPGPAAVGVVIKNQEGKNIVRFGRKIGYSTNNASESLGVIEALNYIKTKFQNVKKIDFYLDSKLLVNQLNGVFKIKNPKLRELLFNLRSLEQEVKAEIFYHLIPREKNLAHQLVEKELTNR